MTFEEFFKKKKIDLPALQQGEQSLYSEFKAHYEQMGEKSFDHTKKYWFNKLRRRFPAPPEIKAEKVRIENPLAEQTITESLTEPVAPAPKLGFAPKFRAAGVTRPTEEKQEHKPEETSAPIEPTAGKPAFKPRFNPGMVKPKPTEDSVTPDEKPEVKEESTTTTPEGEAAKSAYKPRFQPGMVKPKPDQSKEPAPNEKLENKENTQDTEAVKPAYKPRFQASMVKLKPVEGEEKPAENKAGLPPDADEPAYKPRFQAGMVKPKPAEGEEKPFEDKTDTPPDTGEPAAKPAYKPRFNMKNLPPKPTED